MISLFIDTSTSISTLALLKGNILLKKSIIKSNNDLSNNIFSYINDLFNDVSLKSNDIAKIYISIGPGSFTGVRIGVTIAKVIASIRHIPVIPISTLEIFASTVDNEFIVPLIDARRGYVFAGIYNNNLDAILDDQYINIDELKKKCDSNCIFISNDKIFNDIIDVDINIEKIVGKHSNDESVDIDLLIPRYLKKTEAEEKLKNG